MRAMRFAASMKSFDHFPGYAITDVPRLYDWASLGNVSIVDVGGSRGHVAIELAKNFENLKFLVQDMQMVVNGAEADVPGEVKERVSFQAQDLLEEQTAPGDVYFFRMIFHNWGDKYAVKILKSQIPALRPGAKILIQDRVMAAPGEIPMWRERDVRYVALPFDVA